MIPLQHRQPSQSTETDTQLVKRCRDGETAAFDEIVARHQNRVYNLCYWMLSDREEAADAAQEAFVRAFRSLGNFRGECAFSTWLHRVTVNVALDAAQRRKRAPLPFSALENDEDTTREIESYLQSGEVAESPHEVAARRERRLVVRQALAELPEHYRLALVLFDMQGHSYEEVATLLDLPLGTVKSRLNRARLALRDKLEVRWELFQE